MALFELNQSYENAADEWKRPTFKDCVAADIDETFFNEDEHAEWHKVDGKTVLVILEENAVKIRSSHWEAGAKQNFDTGLYKAHTILYIRVKDYGPKPKVGKLLVLDEGTDHKRTFNIRTCEEWAGAYRMTMERVRQ